MSQPEHAGGSGAKKKKKGARGAGQAPEVLWTVRLSMALKHAKEGVVEAARAVGSPDVPTRQMAHVFIASLVCVGLIGGVAGSRYLSYLHSKRASAASAQKEEALLSSFLKKQADLAQRKNVMFPLGQFTLELRSPAGETPKGAMNLADIEIVLECDSRETRFFFEDNLPQARNQVTDVLVAMDRAELLSQDGKLRLKRRLIEKLNTMLSKGHVENLFFSKLILS